MANLTSQMLLNALKDNKSYSATQPFIQAISSGDDSAVEIINNVFLSVLGSDKVSLMTKLLVLRMFKDIFITGNLEMFDKIDPQVQQVIISAAAYNPKFRQKGKNDKETRGAMYFVDTQKRQKNAQSMQLGHSFVILATQIIKFFAAWLPLAPDEAPSRFAQTYQQLEALGVQFNSSIYFQPEQQKKFKKNYEQWRKKLTISSQNEKKETQSQKQHEKDKTKDDEIKVKDQNKAKDPKNKDIKMEKVQKTCAQQKSKANSAQEKQKEHKQQLQKIKKEYETRLTKQQQSKDKMLKSLTDENNQKLEKIKTETIKKQSQIVILQQKCIKLEQENANLRKNSEKLTKDQQRLQATRDSQDKNTIQQLINQKMELQTRLKQQISTNKQFSTRIRTLQLEIDTKNTLNHKLSDELKQIHQQKNGGVAEKEAEILNLKKSIQILQRQRQKDQIQIHMLREQINKKITQMDVFKKSISQQPQQKKDISFKQVPCQKLEQKVGGSQVQKGLFILNEESAQVTTENKKQCSFILQKLQKKRSSDVGNGFILGDNQNKESRSVVNEQKKDVDINQMSLSKYLRTQLQNNKQNLVEADQKRKINNSLHKTESTKFRWDNHMSKQKNKTFQNTRQNLALKRTQNDFFRTGENFRKNRQIITSVFPFLKEYFPSINMESSPYFKSCCLLQQTTHHPFFSDQLIELRVIKSKIKSRKIQISLKNRAPYQIEIKLIAQSPQLEIKQVETVAKLNPFSEHRVTAYIQVTNLNFRFPFLNLTIGLGSRKQRKYRVPVPITLFDFTTISQSHQELANFSRFEQNAYKRHRSERITLNSMLKNLPLCLPFLNFQQNPSTKFESTSIIKYNDLPQVQLKLSIINTEQYTQFQTQFVYTSKINESFSKVLLQVLMFIFI